MQCNQCYIKKASCSSNVKSGIIDKAVECELFLTQGSRGGKPLVLLRNHFAVKGFIGFALDSTKKPR